MALCEAWWRGEPPPRRPSLRPLLLLLFLLAAQPALADDAAIEEIRPHWAACTDLLAKTPDDWTGWRRNYDGGYADHFEFHAAPDVAVLVQTWLIDAIATQTDTSCYRPDGTLAFVFSEMVSPNMAIGDSGPAITREGRLYFAPDGTLIRVLARVVENGIEVAPIDNETYQLARGCGLTAPHANVADVQSHLDAELGDLEGNRPPYVQEPLDWCELVTE